MQQLPPGADGGRRRFVGHLGAAVATAWSGRALGDGPAARGGDSSDAEAQDDARRRDIQMLQTATSIELVTIATYRRVLRLPSVVDGPGAPFVTRLLDTAATHHEQHRLAFEARTEELGGRVQRVPNPRYQALVDDAALGSLLDVVNLATTLEQAAAETFLSHLGLLADTDFRTVLTSVAGVESQHLAVFRTVSSLLQADAADLVRIPLGGPNFDGLPPEIGTVPFPDAFGGTGKASPPDEGAIEKLPSSTTTTTVP